MSGELRPEVSEFAQAMEAKLRTHDDDRGDEWKEMSIRSLRLRLYGEVRELQEAIDKFERTVEIDPAALELVRAEAVDVANFAMMIWNVVSGEEEA